MCVSECVCVFVCVCVCVFVCVCVCVCVCTVPKKDGSLKFILLRDLKTNDGS